MNRLATFNMRGVCVHACLTGWIVVAAQVNGVAEPLSSPKTAPPEKPLQDASQEKDAIITSREEDQSVLEAFLRHILALPPEEAPLLPKSGAQIILHERTPEKTGMIQSAQWESYDTEGKVPEELHQALLARNVEAPPYKAKNVSYRTMEFAPPILLADVRAAQSNRNGDFEKRFPDARAWVEAYQPGYTSDGRHALVAAWVGPTPHGAFALGVLDKKADRWQVGWFRIYWFA